VIRSRMEHLPRLGDTVRFAGDNYAKVTEVIWCLDERAVDGQRVNLRIESESAAPVDSVDEGKL
jgi:hypothetical protein